MNTVLRVLHIASDDSFLSDHEALLKRRGYDVVSVLGNSQAMDLLVSDQEFAFAVVAPEVNPSLRSRLISWLKVVHPKLPVLLPADTPNFGNLGLNTRPVSNSNKEGLPVGNLQSAMSL